MSPFHAPTLSIYEYRLRHHTQGLIDLERLSPCAQSSQINVRATSNIVTNISLEAERGLDLPSSMYGLFSITNVAFGGKNCDNAGDNAGDNLVSRLVHDVGLVQVVQGYDSL